MNSLYLRIVLILVLKFVFGFIIIWVLYNMILIGTVNEKRLVETWYVIRRWGISIEWGLNDVIVSYLKVNAVVLIEKRVGELS